MTRRERRIAEVCHRIRTNRGAKAKFRERLRQARGVQEHQQFADHVKLSRMTLFALRTGRSSPSTRTLYKLCEAYRRKPQHDPEWWIGE